MKKRIFIFVIAIGTVCHSQEKDTLFNEVLTAHRIFKDISYFNVKKIVQSSGRESMLFTEGMENDSIIQVRRTVINALINNLEAFNKKDSTDAIGLIKSYIEKAKELEPKRNKIPQSEIHQITAYFAESNKEASLGFTIKDEKRDVEFSLIPNQHLNLDIQFLDPLKTSDYTTYIFPKKHKYTIYRNCYANAEQPENIKNCKGGTGKICLQMVSRKGHYNIQHGLWQAYYCDNQ